MNCCAGVGAKQWPGLPGNFVDDMHLQILFGHMIKLTKCLKVTFEKLTCYNFFNLLVSIQTLM